LILESAGRSEQWPPSAFHEAQRNGGPAGRRHSNTSQYAALCRDAATVHAHPPHLQDWLPQLRVLLAFLSAGRFPGWFTASYAGC